MNTDADGGDGSTDRGRKDDKWAWEWVGEVDCAGETGDEGMRGSSTMRSSSSAMVTSFVGWAKEKLEDGVRATGVLQV